MPRLNPQSHGVLLIRAKVSEQDVAKHAVNTSLYARARHGFAKPCSLVFIFISDTGRQDRRPVINTDP